MGLKEIPDLIISEQKIIPVKQGNVLHCMKAGSEGFVGFGEAYFSEILPGCVKAWKLHKQMTLNLTVPIGEISFVIFDDRLDSPSRGVFQHVVLGLRNYCRLTVPPNLWVGFQGLGKQQNLLLNIADLPHDPEEAVNVAADHFAFEWKKI